MVVVVVVVVVVVAVYLSVCLSVYLSICLSWKRSYSATLPQFLNLTASKTKQFCETSSINCTWQSQKRSNSARLPICFKVHNIKNEAILREILQTWKVECRADGLVPMRFAIFPVHLSKLLRLPRESDARPYEVLHLSRKIISANLKIWGSKMQPLSGNQRRTS